MAKEDAEEEFDFRKTTMFHFLSQCLTSGTSASAENHPQKFRDFLQELIEEGKQPEDLTREDFKSGCEAYSKGEKAEESLLGRMGILTNKERREVDIVAIKRRRKEFRKDLFSAGVVDIKKASEEAFRNYSIPPGS